MTSGSAIALQNPWFRPAPNVSDRDNDSLSQTSITADFSSAPFHAFMSGSTLGSPERSGPSALNENRDSLLTYFGAPRTMSPEPLSGSTPSSLRCLGDVGPIDDLSFPHHHLRPCSSALVTDCSTSASPPTTPHYWGPIEGPSGFDNGRRRSKGEDHALPAVPSAYPLDTAFQVQWHTGHADANSTFGGTNLISHSSRQSSPGDSMTSPPTPPLPLPRRSVLYAPADLYDEARMLALDEHTIGPLRLADYGRLGRAGSPASGSQGMGSQGFKRKREAYELQNPGVNPMHLVKNGHSIGTSESLLASPPLEAVDHMNVLKESPYFRTSPLPSPSAIPAYIHEPQGYEPQGGTQETRSNPRADGGYLQAPPWPLSEPSLEVSHPSAAAHEPNTRFQPIGLPVLPALEQARTPTTSGVLINNLSQTTSHLGHITYYDPHDPKAVPIPSGSVLALFTDNGVKDHPGLYKCSYIDPSSNRIGRCSKTFKELLNWERHITTRHVREEYLAFTNNSLTIEKAVALRHPKAAVQTFKCYLEDCSWQSKIGDRLDMVWKRHLHRSHAIDWVPKAGRGRPRKRARKNKPAE